MAANSPVLSKSDSALEAPSPQRANKSWLSDNDLQGPISRAARHVDDLISTTDEFFETHSESASSTEYYTADDDDDSDGDSIATDASDDELEMDGVAQDSRGSGGIKKMLRSATVNPSKSALDDQSLVRVFHGLEAANLVALHGYLQGVHIPAEKISSASRLLDQLDSLAKQLAHTLKVSQSTSLTTTPSAPATVPVANTNEIVLGKRNRTDLLLAPSPEKSEKRKNSYGIF